MLSIKSILVCPLDWGLGHASRCIPVIDALMAMGHRVIVAADSAPLALLHEAFPQLDTHVFPGYKPSYSKGNTQTYSMLAQAPALLKQIKKDHSWIENFVTKFHIDGIISDNRFGAYSNAVPSVFITHQLHINLPKTLAVLKPLVEWVSCRIISNYSECWIPDFKGELNLSGKLSHPPFSGISSHYIGPLSRFAGMKYRSIKTGFEPYLLVMLSGPEPQRTILEKIVLQQAADLPMNSIVLRGLPENTDVPKAANNISIFNHADRAQICDLITNAHAIVARGGYTTIMELVSLGRNAVLVPTPGQTEQEYLVSYLHEKGYCLKMKQDDIDLNKALIYEAPHECIEIEATPTLSEHLSSWITRL